MFDWLGNTVNHVTEWVPANASPIVLWGAIGAVGGIAVGVGIDAVVGGIGVAILGTAFAFPIIPVFVILGVLFGLAVALGYLLRQLEEGPSSDQFAFCPA